MFINDRDPIRNDYGMKKKKAENCVNRSAYPFTIPIPALGEAVCKLHEKTGDRWNDVMCELDRLIGIGFLNTSYLQDPAELYAVARELCEQTDDQRDMISPTDALIVAAATVDPNCCALYTTDSSILSVLSTSEKVSDWREEHHYRPLRIHDPSSILKI